MIAVCLYQGGNDAIDFQTRGKYDHAAALLTSGGTIESWWQLIGPTGVQALPSPFAGPHGAALVDVWAIKGWTAERAAWTEEYLRAQLGKPYNLPGIVDFLTRANPTDDGRSFFCSQLVCSALKAAGHPILNLSPGCTAPDHISWSLGMELIAGNISATRWPGTMEMLQGAFFPA